MKFLKTASLVGPYEHVLRVDPAFDAKAKDFAEAYDRAIETGDFSAVPRRAGGPEPVVWQLRHLTDQQWRFVQDLTDRYGLNTSLFDAVALALTGVRGLELEIDRAPDRRRRGWEAVTDEVMARIPDDTVNQLGLRVVAAQNPRNG